jgi:hypothetical protein
MGNVYGGGGLFIRCKARSQAGCAGSEHRLTVSNALASLKSERHVVCSSAIPSFSPRPRFYYLGGKILSPPPPSEPLVPIQFRQLVFVIALLQAPLAYIMRPESLKQEK